MESIVSKLLHFADIQPDAAAVIDHGHKISYGELRIRVQATAAWLHHAGVRPGETVALSLDLAPENSLRSLYCFYASAYLGAAVLPLYPDVPRSRRVELLTVFKARWLISESTQGPIANASPIDPTRFDWRADAGSEFVPPRGDYPDRSFLYFSSSGTTGTPKVCLRTFGQYLQERLVCAAQCGSTMSDREVPAVPWPTAVGLRTLLRLHAVGAALVNARFPETRMELATLIQDFGVTQLWASPWQLRRLLASEMLPGFRLPPLRILFVAGAFISPREIEASRETITPNVYVCYGAGEMGAISVLRPEDPADAAGAVGKLVPGTEGQAVDDHHQPLPPGVVGNLRFRAPWVSHDYAGNEEASARRFRDGWFYPGDVGSIDAAGYVTLRGRTDDVVNFGGVKILPEDIEPVLRQHPDVLDAALVGLPDPMAEQVPVAFVVLRRQVFGKHLFDFCAERVDARQLPVRFVAVSGIPRNPAGKILRDRLRDAYFESVSKQASSNQ